MIDIKDKLTPSPAAESPPVSAPKKAEKVKKRRVREPSSSSDDILQEFEDSKKGITKENLNIAVEKTLA